MPQRSVVAKLDLAVAGRDGFPRDKIATGNRYVVFGAQDD
jgi:hypothetical protein